MTAIEPSVAVQAQTVSPRFIRRLLRQRTAAICGGYLALLIAIAIFAPIILSHAATEHGGDLLAARKGPSWDHLLGTDTLGRDVLQRLLVGTRVTLIGVAEALVVALVVGVPLGLVAGYVGGWADRTVAWLTDVLFSVPSIIVTLLVLAVFPQSMTAAMVTLGVLLSPSVTRVVRSVTLPVREELYVAAAHVDGLSSGYILTRHVLPRIAGPVIVQATLVSAVALVVQTGLAFLGLVVAPPAPSWGGMVADGLKVLLLQPWLIWPAGVVIAMTIVAFGALGDAARDASTAAWSTGQPRRRHRRAGATRPQVPTEETDVPESDALLVVRDLGVAFDADDDETLAVDGVSFVVHAGEAVGLVGESGCGKTLTVTALLGLLPGSARIAGGSVRLEGRELTALSERALERVRGREVGFVSQEAMVGLNPAFRVGWQLAHAVRTHHGCSRREARDRALTLLARVHLPEPEWVAARYPHELSGGMAQRVAIARALAGEPRLLVADEPTTALDVTVQAEILDLLRELQRDRGMALLLVTHDWGVVADICDRAVVMYAGQVVERADVALIFDEPRHPYTEALLASDPHHAATGGALPSIPGSVPTLGAWPRGCHFHPRCRYATNACVETHIPLLEPQRDRQSRCLHHDRLVRQA